LVIGVNEEHIVASLSPHNGKIRGDRALAAAAFAAARYDDHGASYPFSQYGHDIDSTLLRHHEDFDPIS
jgi:hypothetical protein